MDTSGLDKFFLEVFKTNRVYVLERWDEWQAFIKETLKAEVEKKYPEGFKDFLVEKMDAEIKLRAKNIKKFERKAEKATAKAE